MCLIPTSKETTSKALVCLSRGAQLRPHTRVSAAVVMRGTASREQVCVCEAQIRMMVHTHSVCYADLCGIQRRQVVKEHEILPVDVHRDPGRGSASVRAPVACAFVRTHDGAVDRI